MFDDAEASRPRLPRSNGTRAAPRRPAGPAVGAVPAAERRCSGTEASGVIQAPGAIPEYEGQPALAALASTVTATQDARGSLQPLINE